MVRVVGIEDRIAGWLASGDPKWIAHAHARQARLDGEPEPCPPPPVPLTLFRPSRFNAVRTCLYRQSACGCSAPTCHAGFGDLNAGRNATLGRCYECVAPAGSPPVPSGFPE